ncbi:protein-export membrane protein SecF [Iodidimonas gelatinilytica]|uniref:Protein-export membrane protein SecF n=1 Tax=Iodidimonas gelatinilytica TaxID=1236966 RepID=A0A5A7MYQ3_9PROT|nr:protein translocase subunit SecF [Iodidimonas gelatinilytica]GEQ96957.1 protein-export membrane protein SecF [Iodidimonas gelatinilytica]GER00494.1 protein-export membrane protein SecF [Iodidimonas gelatinilytica]
MLLRLIPKDTHIPFMKVRNVAYAISLVMVVASVALFFMRGLNLGIDFVGGSTIEIQTPEAADVGKIRTMLEGLDLGDVSVQEFGADTEVLIRFEEQEGGEEAQKAAQIRVEQKLQADIPGVSIRSTSFIGPKVSSELARDGFLAVSLSVVAVLIYIWFRFEWQFGLGAVVALVHDVFLTVGFFSITQLDFNLSIIAAILTIVGYSLNDTVVVYDRVRENMRKFRKMPLPELIDQSVNDTLSRTIMTSLTTLLALAALFFFGGTVIRGFTAAMIWGIVVGTYSSIFIASPVLLLLNLRSTTFDKTDGDNPNVESTSLS